MIDRLSDLGDLFRGFREARGLTQDELAATCGDGVNRSHVAHLEQGLRLPKPERLAAIANRLGIPESVWTTFAREDSHERHQFESALSELVGRIVALRAMDMESVRAAEVVIRTLFS